MTVIGNGNDDIFINGFCFDGNFGIILLPGGMDGILNQIDEDLTELVVIAEDFAGIGDIDQKLDGAQFVGKKVGGVFDDATEGCGSFGEFITPRESTKVGDNADNPANGITEVCHGFVVVFDFVFGDVGAIGFEKVDCGIGVVQRVVDFVDNTGAHLSQRG